MATKIRSAKVNTKKEIKEELRELTIKNFKQFSEINFNDFGKINIFFGNNNCGKTSILEAIFMFACGHNSFNGLNQLTGRRDTNIKGFYDYGDKLLTSFKENSQLPYKFEISGKFENIKEKVKMSYSFLPSSELAALDPRNMGNNDINFDFAKQQNTFEDIKNINGIGNIFQNIPTQYLGKLEINIDTVIKKSDLNFPNINITAEKPIKLAAMHDILAHRDTRNDMQIYSQLKRYNVIDEMVINMKKIFPIIDNIDYIPYPDGNSGAIYVKTTDGRNLPLYVFGDGMRRWFYLLGRMIVNQNAIHCIEEIDSTLHFEAQEDFSRNLVQYCQKYNNQLFITSHSIEFADNFLEILYGKNGIIKETDDDIIRFYTLKSVETEKGYDVDIWKFTGREAYEKRESFGMELR